MKKVGEQMFLVGYWMLLTAFMSFLVEEVFHVQVTWSGILLGAAAWFAGGLILVAIQAIQKSWFIKIGRRSEAAK